MKRATPTCPAKPTVQGQMAEVFLSSDADQVVHLLADGTVLRVPACRYRSLGLGAKNSRWPAFVFRLVTVIGACTRLALLAASLWRHQ